MRHLDKWLTVILLATMGLAGCGQAAAPTATPLPTVTILHTDLSTATPVPTQLTEKTTLPEPTLLPKSGQTGFCPSGQSLPQGFQIIGYLPDYRDVNVDWGNCLTDILYFSAEPTDDGSLDSSRLTEDVLSNLLLMKQRYGTHVYVSLGGDQRSGSFSAVTTQADLRNTFVQSLIHFGTDHQLDGFDFDWEFPSTAAELDGYIGLMQAVQAGGFKVTVALAPSEDIPASRFAFADRIHIMSYDRGSRHSTYEQAVQDTQLFIDAGLDPKKLALGIPFYGRNMQSPHDEMTYADILSTYHPSPELNEEDGIYYNGPDMVQKKTCFARQAGLGGVMIWELGQDSPADGSLLKAIHTAAVSGCQ
jgi:chitinase